MNKGHDIKALLSIFMQTENYSSFSDHLEACNVHYTLIVDPIGYNLFHELANSIIKEENIMRFWEILILSFNNKYKEKSANIIKEMLNSQTLTDHQTPLLLAINRDRMVIDK